MAALVRHAMSWIGLIVLIRKDIACLSVGIANYVMVDLDPVSLAVAALIRHAMSRV